MHGVAPYTRLMTAADLRFRDLALVTSAAAYLGWHRLHLAEAGAFVTPWACDLSVDARVNHGRWIADCPNCKGGAFTHPAWKLACCGECGCVMRHVQFPDDIQMIEILLLARSTRDVQNWFPSETLADLMRENSEHAVGG